ncbi:hypothetical protein RGQ29_020133 [Quercus rubra]|uniref:Uncharacterized protein n=1 Tax=Quercus rubra TaxID=3512 RepID=A0AAN7IWR2_QUERU|nr:hypothetical protein RGQ29_020133 [Quercus rubra]
MGSFSVLPPEARRLEGKVALITGAASGIAKVVIADTQDELGHSICKELNPQSTTFVHCDVTKEIDVENAVNHAVSMYGKLDIMYNNAGIVGEAKFNILENTQADFEQVAKVNLVARVMIPTRKGSIINTASASSTTAGGAPHAYTSSKHAVHGLKKNTAKFFKMDDDEASHVYSNLKGEVLKPEDVAETALFLASEDSKYVSGHNLLIDGGFSIHNAGFCIFPQ